MSVPGDRIGPYVTLRVLGRGGMGEVLLARDPRLQRKVALKSVIAGEGDAASRDQILREARAAALISHPNVAHVYDVLEQGPRLFIVMEYVEGDTLAHPHRARTASFRRRRQHRPPACYGPWRRARARRDSSRSETQ